MRMNCLFKTIAALSLLWILSTPTYADLVFEITEGVGVVDVSLTGSIDLDATLGFAGGGSNTERFLFPSAGPLSVGDAQNGDLYNINVSSWTAFGNGGFTTNGTGTGDRVGLFINPVLGLPSGYVSGTALSGTSSFVGSFASLGLTPGNYVTTLDSGIATDTISVNVSAVPEPSSLLLLGIATSLITLNRRRFHNRE